MMVVVMVMTMMRMMMMIGEWEIPALWLTGEHHDQGSDENNDDRDDDDENHDKNDKNDDDLNFYHQCSVIWFVRWK